MRFFCVCSFGSLSVTVVLTIYRIFMLFIVCVAVDGRIWEQVIELYPRLVECSVCNSTQVRRALREALQEYADLLKPPTHASAVNGNR